MDDTENQAGGSSRSYQLICCQQQSPRKGKDIKYLIMQGAECLHLLSVLVVIESISIPCQERLQGMKKRAAAYTCGFQSFFSL